MKIYKSYFHYTTVLVMTGAILIILGAVTIAQTFDDLNYRATEPDALRYSVSFDKEMNKNGDISTEALQMTAQETTSYDPEDSSKIRGELTMDYSGGQEQEVYTMTVKGENIFSNTDFMFVGSFPNYRAFPILPSGTVDIDSQWSSSLKVRSLSYPTTFNVNITHTLTSQTTKNGYDVVKIEYTYSGSPEVEETGTYKFEEITGNGTAYFAFNEGFVVSKAEHSEYTQETRKVKDTGGYDVLDSKVVTSDMTAELQEVATP